jgi:hypothetical protein
VVDNLYPVRETIVASSRIEPVSRDLAAFFIAPLTLQLCLSQSAEKALLGGVFLTEFPQCGLECSHPANRQRSYFRFTVNFETSPKMVLSTLKTGDAQKRLFSNGFSFRKPCFSASRFVR